MKLYTSLIIASMKMYYRNKHAIIWSLFFPLVIMLIFGLFNFEKYNPPKIGIDNRGNSESSKILMESLLEVKAKKILEVDFDSEAQLYEKLEKGELHAFLVIPEDFGLKGVTAEIKAFYDKNRPEEKTATEAVLSKSLAEVFNETIDIPTEYTIESRFKISEQIITTRGQGFKGFLVPGVAAMAIMQTGLFSVTFTLIRFKVQGVLRRLNATPIGASHFIIGQLITRVIVVLVQTYILIFVGILVLGVTIGSKNPFAWLEIAIVSLIGGAVFLSIGLAISGWAKTEDTAAPITNLISMPMMFLSGVFFPLSVMPSWVANFAKFLPLTFLADSLRAIAVGGATITDLGYQMLGLFIWLLVGLTLAVKLFKWE